MNAAVASDKPMDQLLFIMGLAQTKPAMLHDLMMVRLETILAKMLHSQMRENDGVKNKSQKKKLK